MNTDIDTHTENRPHEHLVKVQLNGTAKEIKGGHYKGRHLRMVLGVPAEHELDLVVSGEFRPIANEDDITVHGGEVFVSHCGQGASS
jgi:hypothetical protein